METPAVNWEKITTKFIKLAFCNTKDFPKQGKRLPQKDVRIKPIRPSIKYPTDSAMTAK
jgi:hypothetical protein